MSYHHAIYVLANIEQIVDFSRNLGKKLEVS